MSEDMVWEGLPVSGSWAAALNGRDPNRVFIPILIFGPMNWLCTARGFILAGADTIDPITWPAAMVGDGENE